MDIVVKEPRTRINPQKFALWLAMGSIVMLFGAFTSAYLVKQAAGNWLEYKMPMVFYVNTGAIVLSSLVLHTSVRGFKSGRETVYKVGLLVTLFLALTFIVLQYVGWTQLYNVGVDLKQNVSGSFLYLITGVHALHVLGGVAAIITACIHAFTLKFKVTQKRVDRFELVLHYWHFMGALWIYLFVFLLMSK